MNPRYDTERHRRRSIRLEGYDYSQPGAYFVTICTNKKECLLGEIIRAKMELSPIGEIVQNEWYEIPERFRDARLDVFVIMPNHIHGIIVINDIVGATLAVASNNGVGTRPTPTFTLGDIVGAFKSLCVHKSIKHNFDVGKLWQRNYYEHIIRTEEKLNYIREYIINNPLQWQFDRENPRRIRDRAYDDQWGRFEKVLYGR